MEPFGAAVSVLTVIQMTHKAVFSLYESYRTIRDADDDRLHIIRDVRDLERVLNRTLDIVSDQRAPADPRRDHVAKLLDYLESKDSPVIACQEEIEAIQTILEKHKGKLSWTIRKKEVQERLQNVERYKGRLTAAMHASSIETILAVESILHAQSDMLSSHIQRESESAILAWLNCPDVQSNLIAAVEKRQAGTGEWLLRSARFKEWMGEPQLLWLTGLPGSGKTIISSTIIATLLGAMRGAAGRAVVYFYFDFHSDAKRETRAFLHVVLSQLATQSADAFEELRKLYQSTEGAGRRPTTEELVRTARKAFDRCQKVYVVVDALDECDEPAHAVELLRRLADAPNAHVMAVSRREADIERKMQGVSEFVLEGADMDADIASYVRQRIVASEYMQEWPLEEQEKVEKHLESKAQSMFRWVQCQLDAVEKCLGSDEIDETLATLPPTLPETYERILANIGQRQQPNVYKALNCLTFGLRPFTPDEVKNVIQTTPRDDIKFRTKPVFIKQLLNALSSLVNSSVGSQGMYSQSASSPELRLAHFSVKEYLLSEFIANSTVRSFSLSNTQGHLEMAEYCVSCLIHFDSIEDFGPKTLESYPFLSYAAANWMHHAQLANDADVRGSLDDLIFDFFHNKPGAYVNWHRLHSPDQPSRGIHWAFHIQDGAARDKDWLANRHRIRRPLFNAARWNLWRVVAQLVRAGEDVNAWNSGNWAALHVAAREASLESMDALVGGGRANVNQADWAGFRPLHSAAAWKQQPRAVEWLLRHGADAQLASAIGGVPLQYAAFVGARGVVAAMLRGGVNPNAYFEHYHEETVFLATPLQHAAYSGSVPCMELFLKHGAGLENYPTGFKIGSALHAAALGGQVEAAKFLMGKAVDPRLKTGTYGTVLSAAAYGGNKSMVEFLLDAGVSYQEFDVEQEKAWPDLDPTERSRLVELMITEAGEKFCSNILEAAKRGLSSMVRRFIDKGADIEATENFHLRSPLNWAAANGHLEVVKTLANAGASVHRINRNSASPFVVACTGGHLEVAKYLLAKGASMNHRDQWSRTGLMCAEMGGYTVLSKLLRDLEQGKEAFEWEGKTFKLDKSKGRCVPSTNDRV